MYRKFKKVVLGLLVHVTPFIFFSRILRSKKRSEALIYKSYFFRRAVLRKLFDIRFSYKHNVISHAFAYTRQDGVENRDKVYYVLRNYQWWQKDIFSDMTFRHNGSNALF